MEEITHPTPLDEEADFMRRSMLKSKIHRATVTHADVNYEGSLTLDSDLLQAADIIPFEEVHVWNVTRGTRFRTYAMLGPQGSGVVCANGAAALLAKPGDLVIIASFTIIDDADGFRPRLVFVDDKNQITSTKIEKTAGPMVV